MLRSDSQPNKKLVYISILVAFFLIATLCGVLFAKNTRIATFDTSGYVLGDEEMMFSIEGISIGNRVFCISGWAALAGESTGYADLDIALLDPRTDKYTLINTAYVERTDVTETYDDGYDYSHSGFTARSLLGSFDAGIDYNILIVYQTNGNKILVDTGHTIAF